MVCKADRGRKAVHGREVVRPGAAAETAGCCAHRIGVIVEGISAGLRQENQRLAAALAEAQKAKPGGHKFKPGLHGKNKA